MILKKVIESSGKSKNKIGPKIQGLLDMHQLSLSKLAAATNLTAETIRQIINGTIKNPGIETLSKIAEAFSISLFQLIESKDVTSHITKKRIKIIDIFELEKSNPKKCLNDIINQSIESTEVLYIENNYDDSDFFALKVSATLADKLTSSGMPILKESDLLIFSCNDICTLNSIILVKHKNNELIFGIAMDIEANTIWIKSVDIPQKQIIIKINRKNIIGVVHNVQFNY